MEKIFVVVAFARVVLPVTLSVEESVVAPVTARVPVAVRFPPMNASPPTANFVENVVVPIPTLPVLK